MWKEEITRRKGDLRAKIKNNLLSSCKTCKIQPILMAQSSSLAPSGGLLYINCGPFATPSPLLSSKALTQ